MPNNALAVEMTPELRRILKAEANAMGMTLNAYVAYALRSALVTGETKKTPTPVKESGSDCHRHSW